MLQLLSTSASGTSCSDVSELVAQHESVRCSSDNFAFFHEGMPRNLSLDFRLGIIELKLTK